MRITYLPLILVFVIVISGCVSQTKTIPTTMPSPAPQENVSEIQPQTTYPSEDLGIVPEINESSEIIPEEDQLPPVF